MDAARDYAAHVDGVSDAEWDEYDQQITCYAKAHDALKDILAYRAGELSPVSKEKNHVEILNFNT